MNLEYIENITIEQESEATIDLSESMGWVSGDNRYHDSLLGVDFPNQHPITAISNLKEELDEIKKTSGENFAFDTAIRFLARNMRTESEIRKKLEITDNFVIGHELVYISLPFSFNFSPFSSQFNFLSEGVKIISN